VVLLAVAVAVAAALAAVLQVTRALPAPRVATSVASSVTVPGGAPALPWPGVGQAAVSVPSVGYAASSGPDTPVPIASLTKMTTAVLVLHDHPIPPGAPGPGVTMGPADVAFYEHAIATDQSNVPVQVGEILTERQLLEGLMNQSANNFAYTLADWDAGSQAAFVAKMNALAALLGMTATHYVDASGYQPQSVSSAVDVLKVAAFGMAMPTFAEVVSLATVTLPIVGTVHNIVAEVGQDGVVGVKSGFTTAAGGCMVLAAYRTVAGQPVLVLSSVTGQMIPVPPPPTTTTTTTTVPGTPAPPPTAPTTTTTTTTTAPPDGAYSADDPLRYAGPAAQSLLDAARAALVPVTVATAGDPVASATAVWGGTAHTVSVVTAGSATLAAWPGQQVAVSHLVSVPAGARRDDGVGSVRYRLGLQQAVVGLRLDGTVREPTWWWRLTHP
jgi:D-alanyl-D-alanine carboxypeptidase (penicillin-binding protein 5/6)